MPVQMHQPWLSAPQRFTQPQQSALAPNPTYPASIDPALTSRAVANGFAAGWGPDEPRKKSPLGAPIDLSPQVSWNQPDTPAAHAPSIFDPLAGGRFAAIATMLTPSAPRPTEIAEPDPKAIGQMLLNGGGIY